MSYTDLTYLGIFLPIVVILYNVLPQKHRWKVLLGASYVFFWSISGKQDERNEKLKEVEKEKKKELKQLYVKKQRKLILIGVLILIGTLVVLKYTNFFGTNINNLFEALNIDFKINIPHFIMPIGISFYTLQAVSYIVDVYKEKFSADKNIGRIALFLGFFPGFNSFFDSI